MRKQAITVFCAACLALGVQAKSSSDTTGSSSSSSSDPSSSGYRHHVSGAAGQEVKASQLTGAQVTGSSGQTLGTISDAIINAGSGRVDFAILSISETGASASPSSSGSATSPGSSSSSSSSSLGSPSSSASPGSASSAQGGATSPGSSSTGASATGGKQVAVPWALLRPSMSGSSASSASQAPTFTFAGDASKLQAAPNFDPNTDLTQPGWRRSIFSYYGLSGAGSATGGAESPGGVGGSTGSSSSPGNSSSGSDSSSGSSSSSTQPK